LRLILNEWMIHYREQQWALRRPPARIEVDSLAYRIDNFRMASGQTDSSQFVLADGIISRQGEEDFKLEIANLDLSKLAEAFRLNMDASGFLNLNAKMNGTASSPQLKGDFNLQEAVLNEYPMKKTEGSFDYSNHRMNLSATVIPRDSGKIVFSGHVPLKLKLDSMQANFNPKDRINAQLLVQRFPFAVLNAFIMADEVKGLINGKVTLDGTVESPDPKGRIAMKQGSIKMNKYGIDYRTIDFAVNFLPEKIALDTLFIRSDDGRMTGTGQMDFNSAFYKGEVKKSAINLHFNKFNPFDHDQFNMQLSGRANLSGEKGKVVFDGDLKVPQSEIFLPTVLSMFGKVSSDELPEPILIREMNRMKAGNDTLPATGDTLTALSDTLTGNNDAGADPGAREQIAEKDSTAPTYLDNVTGKIKLNIPRNTWIKSDDMHIELSGDLELRKNKDFFELFGTVDVVRGQYDLLGKTFVIDQGSVRFQGGEEIKPQLDITASYGFRASGTVDQNLTVHVRGTPESPKVSFSMAGDSINEGDALSYILFGRGMNELTADQQANVAGSGGGGTIAGKAAASLISSQISDFLGQKLNMDYLEIKSDAGFENTTIVVGKYITNNIFMSYEQRVGEKSDRDERATYEVRLEYELFKFLFFQLNSSSTDSGFDVIFKLNSRGRGSGPSM
jgi:translocation and assembly module TamB